jgi:hypothetical protein
MLRLSRQRPWPRSSVSLSGVDFQLVVTPSLRFCVSVGREDRTGTHPTANTQAAPLSAAGSPWICGLHYVRLAPILLQKYFWGRELKFSEPLMRLAPRDVRDHIVSRQNDHGPSYRRNGASQRRRCLEIDFREIWRRRIFDFCNKIRQKRPFDSEREYSKPHYRWPSRCGNIKHDAMF